MRIIIDILEYYEAHPQKQIALIFLDSQKAFDNVNWQFIIQQMEIMEFGEYFINSIKSIYKEILREKKQG